MSKRLVWLSSFRLVASRARPSILSALHAQSYHTSRLATIPKQRGAFALFGLCCALGAPRSCAAVARSDDVPLPIHDLSLLHAHFGGDASVHDNQPMPQAAPSGGTISALSVQIPALQKLAPYLRTPGAEILDLGFGSGVMVAMMLAVAGEGAKVVGCDLEDKVSVATQNLRSSSSDCPFVPFPFDSFSLLGGDAFEYMEHWKSDEKTFDVVYSGCSMDPATDQLRLFLGRLKPTGAAVFNLGRPGRQGMYFVADRGKICELLMVVNFMMAESLTTPRNMGPEIPLDPRQLGAWIRKNVFKDDPEL